MYIRRLCLAVFCFFSGTLLALDLELTQGINSAYPIAIHSFGSNRQATDLKAVIDNDLKLSGQFRLLPMPYQASSSSQLAAIGKGIGADSVLTGEVSPLGGNRYAVKFELLDSAANGRLLLAKQFQVGPQQLRSLAHHISDLVYEKLTGTRGVFSTRIAYVSVQRNARQSQSTLEVADADGYNPRSLVVSNEPIMSPSWSPDGSQIAYVSFEKKKAQIFTVSVATGQRRLISAFTGINGAPAWSPDGRQLAVVLSKSGSPKIYSIELSSGSIKQLTFGPAIDTEPRYSPDGRSILFTSGRGGAPQIYKLSLADGSISRVTYEGRYNARASMTPDQKYIVMLHREDRDFNIGVQEIRSGRINEVTGSGADESPSVSPNGRMIVYATKERGQGVLGMVSIDGSVKVRIPAREGDVQEPAWSPFLG